MRVLKRIIKNKIFIFLSLLSSAGILFVIGFHVKCRSTLPNFVPINEKYPVEQVQAMEQYVRPEESTYLTFPEWYLVFNPQEYGQFLEANAPSGFPYFSSIGQFWSGYCTVYGITTPHYGLNAGNHLMLAVIGTSFTAEYLVKGIYENTIGRLTEWMSGQAHTEEDRYAAAVAQEYGNFIPTMPWYEFPYTQRFIGVWKTSLWGKHVVRKWERKIFLSLEYGVKTVYALLIKGATRALYGVADTEVYAIVEQAPDVIFDDTRVRKVEELGEQSFVIAVPHYQGFTDTVPMIARQGVRFLTVAGNDEILLTAIAPREFYYTLTDGTLLFTQDMMTTQDTKRIAVQVPLSSLSTLLMELEARGIRLEHLYDY